MDDSLARLYAAYERKYGPIEVSHKPLRIRSEVTSHAEGFHQMHQVHFWLEPSDEPIATDGPPPHKVLADLTRPQEGRLKLRLMRGCDLARQVFEKAGIPSGSSVYCRIGNGEWIPAKKGHSPADAPISFAREEDLAREFGYPADSNEALAGEVLGQFRKIARLDRPNSNSEERDEAIYRFAELCAALQVSVMPYYLDGRNGRPGLDIAKAGVRSRAGRQGTRARWKIDEAAELKKRRARGHTNGQLAKYIQDKYKRRTSRSIEAGIAEMIASGKI